MSLITAMEFTRVFVQLSLKGKTVRTLKVSCKHCKEVYIQLFRERLSVKASVRANTEWLYQGNASYCCLTDLLVTLSR